MKQSGLEVFGTYHTGNPFPKDKHIFKADLTSKKNVQGLLKGVDIIIHAAAT
jgi:putative NADH-flavin reductase